MTIGSTGSLITRGRWFISLGIGRAEGRGIGEKGNGEKEETERRRRAKLYQPRRASTEHLPFTRSPFSLFPLPVELSLMVGFPTRWRR
jgi:hypothetical protein